MPKMELKAHPLLDKLERVFAKMEDEDVRFTIGPYNELFVHYDGIRYQFEDIQPTWTVSDLPPTAEYRIIIQED